MADTLKEHALRELTRTVEGMADDLRLSPEQWKKLAIAMNRAHKALGWLRGYRWDTEHE